MPKGKGRSRPRSWMDRYRPYISAVGRAVKTGYQYYQYRTLTKNRRGTAVSGVTTQHDSKTQYRRRRAPRRVRRRARRAMRRFIARNMKLVGTRQYLANTSGTVSSAVGKQAWDSFILYGYGPSVGAADARGYNDINALVANDTMLSNTVNDPSNRFSGGNTRCYFDTGIFDITFQNNTNVTIGGVNQGAGVEMDLYEFIVTRKIDAADASNGANGITYHNFISNMYGNDNLRQGAGLFQIDPQNRGATPFEFGTQLYQAGIKITKKTKYFVPFGNTVTYQMRDSRNHEFSTRDMANNAQPGTTFSRGIFVIAKILPASQAADPTGVVNIAFGCTRKYKYKVFSSAPDRSGQS